MSVVIKDMEMPENCFRCDIHKSCSHAWYLETTHRPDDCPLVDIPTPHGKLIEASALYRAINIKATEPEYQHTGEDWKVGLYMAEDLTYNLPAIIEAEGE